MEYVIRSIDTNMYYASDYYVKYCNHYVADIKEAKRFKRKMIALNIVKRFNHPEHFEIIPIRKVKKNGK